MPRADRLTVPDGRLGKAPAFRYRKYGYEDGPQKDAFKLLNWYRLRMETETMKCVHGHRRLKLYERFGKTHPEYFANHHNSHVQERVRRRGHLCHSSKVWDEIERDAMKYFADGGTDIFGLTTKHDATEASRKIYTPALIRGLETLLNEAEAMTTRASSPRRRVEWIRTEYLEPLQKAYGLTAK